MADEPEVADANESGDPTADLDLAAMGLEEPTDEELAAAAVAKARPTRKTDPNQGKDKATPRQKRSRPGEEHRRATPAQFVRESVGELKKVVWPTGSQLQQYFVVVLVFVLLMIGIVMGLDLGFGALMLKALG